MAELLKLLKNAPSGTSIYNYSTEEALDFFDDTDSELNIKVEIKDNQLQEFVDNLKSFSGIFTTHHKLGFSFPNTFTGSALVDYIVDSQRVNAETAVDFGKKLILYRFIKSVFPKPNLGFFNDTNLYHLVEGCTPDSLNTGFLLDDFDVPKGNFVHELQCVLSELYSKVLFCDHAVAVSFETLLENKVFIRYLRLASQLTTVDLSTLTRSQSLSFFINVFNALYIHGYLVHGFPTTRFSRLKFLYKTSYSIGGNKYSLMDIRDGVLRGNSFSPSTLTPPFPKNDPRLNFVIQPFEPLIHFSLTAGTRSSPPLRVYSADNVCEELQFAASQFLLSDKGCTIDMFENSIGINSIFRWYKKDLSHDDSLSFIIQHLPEGSKKTNLEILLDAKCLVKFVPFDWDMDFELRNYLYDNA